MRLRTLLAMTLIGPLAGCGGGGSPSGPSSPPPGPARTLVAQGTQSNIRPASEGAAYFLIVTAPANATLEATVDWTSASNQIGIAWSQGDCTTNSNCIPLEENVGPDKPKTLRVSNVAAGNYTLIIVNFGTTTESVSFQLFLVH